MSKINVIGYESEFNSLVLVIKIIMWVLSFPFIFMISFNIDFLFIPFCFFVLAAHQVLLDYLARECAVSITPTKAGVWWNTLTFNFTLFTEIV